MLQRLLPLLCLLFLSPASLTQQAGTAGPDDVPMPVQSRRQRTDLLSHRGRIQLNRMGAAFGWHGWALDSSPSRWDVGKATFLDH